MDWILCNVAGKKLLKMNCCTAYTNYIQSIDFVYWNNYIKNIEYVFLVTNEKNIVTDAWTFRNLQYQLTNGIII